MRAGTAKPPRLADHAKHPEAKERADLTVRDSARSAVSKSARKRSFRADWAAASTFSRVRPTSVRSKPSARKPCAIASPIPDEPPVTSAARFMSHLCKSEGDLAEM